MLQSTPGRVRLIHIDQRTVILLNAYSQVTQCQSRKGNQEKHTDMKSGICDCWCHLTDQCAKALHAMLPHYQLLVLDSSQIMICGDTLKLECTVV